MSLLYYLLEAASEMQHPPVDNSERSAWLWVLAWYPQRDFELQQEQALCLFHRERDSVTQV
jgi:hypothetical protein